MTASQIACGGRVLLLSVWLAGVWLSSAAWREPGGPLGGKYRAGQYLRMEVQTYLRMEVPQSEGGHLRYAFNYGEVRFPVLQQLLEDSQSEWSHKNNTK